MIILSAQYAFFLSFSMWVGQISRIPLPLVLAVFMLSHGDYVHYFIFGGFPWGIPAYSQGEWLRFFQWVDHTGVFGLNAYIYLVNGLIAEGMILTYFKRQIDKLMSRLVVVLVLALLSLYGSFLAKQEFERSKKVYGQINVALMQGNISQDMKWDARHAKENLSRYIKMTTQAFKNGAELVIWPETAYPFGGLQEESFSVAKFLDQEKVQAPLFIGAMTTRMSAEGERHLFNSVVHVDTDAHIKSVYHKMHLVPMGEYIPFKSVLGRFKKLTVGMGDFTAGSDYTLFHVSGIAFGSLICFEDVFFDPARQMARRGANVLVNYSNDAWYGQSSALYQHMVYSQFRALENRKPLLRATNTGLTAMISAGGEVIQELAPFKVGVLQQSLKIEGAESAYTRWGNGWIRIIDWMTGLMLLYAVIKWKFGPVKIDL
jgi:apolipoprotein N-acyltransferase